MMRTLAMTYSLFRRVSAWVNNDDEPETEEYVGEFDEDQETEDEDTDDDDVDDDEV